MKILELNGKKGYTVQLSNEDYERVRLAGPWFPLESKHHDGSIRSVRARRNVRGTDGKPQQQYMGAFILGLQKGSGTDAAHRDNNGLNCQRNNIVAATRSQTCAKQRLRADNAFGLKGVTRRKSQCGKFYFMAQLDHSYLGSFGTAEKAARAYDAAAKLIYGEFALLNFPEVNQ